MKIVSVISVSSAYIRRGKPAHSCLLTRFWPDQEADAPDFPVVEKTAALKDDECF
jgi:hypothetical protein